MSLIQNRQFRNTILEVLVKLYMGLSFPDYISVCHCLIFIDRPQGVAEILEKLVKSTSEDNILMGYQIAFDMYESATQQFLQRVQVFDNYNNTKQKLIIHHSIGKLTRAL